jgi:hypothetical protein
MFYEKKILFASGYCKLVLFRRLLVTLILVDHETGYVEKLISSALHAYEERQYQRSYASRASIWF